MRFTSSMFALALLFPIACMGADNCANGQRQLNAGEPCIPEALFNYLYCLSRSGGGKIEVSKKDENSGSKALEVSLSGKGSGVVISGEGAVGYKTSDANRTVKELVEKIDPTLAANCKDLAPGGGAGGAQPDSPGGGSVKHTGPMGPLEPGVSYNQGDIYYRPASSPQQCSTLCYNDDECVASTFIISQQRCWIKNSIGTVGKSSDMVSAKRSGAGAAKAGNGGHTGSMAALETGISYNGGDIYGRPASSPQECSTLCYNDDRCVAATFVISQQRCWIKDSIGPVGKSNDMISARKLAK